MTRAFRLLFLLSLPFAIWSFLSCLSANPHGGWDAWAIWNLHAKFIAFGGVEHWRDYAQLWWTHPDYPLFLPGLVAVGWKVFGYSIWVPVAIAGLFTFGTVALLVVTIKGWQGYAAALVLLSCHLFIACGASEYADEPLGFFLLATVAAARRDKWLLAGIYAGLCVATKQEGLIVGICFIIAAARSFPISVPHANAVWGLSLGMLPLMATPAHSKSIMMAGRNLASYWAVFASGARWEAVAAGCWQAATGPFLVPAIAIAGAILLLRPSWTREATMLGLIWAGYMLAIVLSPFDVNWQWETAGVRLLMQLLPAVFYVVFSHQ